MPRGVLYVDGDPAVKFRFSFLHSVSSLLKIPSFSDIINIQNVGLEKNSGVPHPRKLSEIMTPLGIIYLVFPVPRKALAQ